MDISPAVEAQLASVTEDSAARSDPALISALVKFVVDGTPAEATATALLLVGRLTNGMDKTDGSPHVTLKTLNVIFEMASASLPFCLAAF